MPFAKVTGGVAGAFEISAHGREPPGVDRRGIVGLYSGLDRIAPGKDGGSRRYTERIGAIGASEQHAVRGQAIHMGRFEILFADAAAHGIGRLLVRGDEEDVGVVCGERPAPEFDRPGTERYKLSSTDHDRSSYQPAMAIGSTLSHAVLSGMPATIVLLPYRDTWPEGDQHANFKSEVACYSTADPMPTLENLSRGTGIPIGCLARYILVKWSASNAEALMAVGPIVFAQMKERVERAEAAGTDEARLGAYDALRQIIGWLAHGSAA